MSKTHYHVVTDTSNQIAVNKASAKIAAMNFLDYRGACSECAAKARDLFDSNHKEIIYNVNCPSGKCKSNDVKFIKTVRGKGPWRVGSDLKLFCDCFPKRVDNIF